MKILQALEVVSNNLLKVMKNIEILESENISSSDKAILLYIKEQSIVSTTLILVLNDNIKEYEINFVKIEIKTTQEFCKKALNRLKKIENTLN